MFETPSMFCWSCGSSCLWESALLGHRLSLFRFVLDALIMSGVSAIRLPANQSMFVSFQRFGRIAAFHLFFCFSEFIIFAFYPLKSRVVAKPTLHQPRFCPIKSFPYVKQCLVFLFHSFSVYWFIGARWYEFGLPMSYLLVCCIIGVLVSWFQSFLVSKFQTFKD